MKRSEWMNVVAEIRVRWPQQDAAITEAWIALGWAELGDLPAEVVIAAVREYDRSGGTFLPRLGALRTAAQETLGHGEADPATVTAIVLLALSRQATKARPVWTDPEGRPARAIDAAAADRLVLSFGGWRSLCTREDYEHAVLPYVGLRAREACDVVSHREALIVALPQRKRLPRSGTGELGPAGGLLGDGSAA